MSENICMIQTYDTTTENIDLSLVYLRETTITSKLHSLERPPESVQVHVTLVVPKLKKEPDIGLHIGVILPSSASVQAPMFQSTKLPMFSPRPLTSGTLGQTGTEGAVFADKKKEEKKGKK